MGRLGLCMLCACDRERLVLSHFLFIITDKAKVRRGGSVCVVKDEELELEEIEATHTLG